MSKFIERVGLWLMVSAVVYTPLWFAACFVRMEWFSPVGNIWSRFGLAMVMIFVANAVYQTEKDA